MSRTRLPENELGIKLTNKLLLGNIKLKDNPYWLGNRGEGGLINQGLLKGGTLEDLKNYSKSKSNKRVSNHIAHLKKRGLKISESNSNGKTIFKFEIKNLSKKVTTSLTSIKLNKKEIYTEGKPNEVLVTLYERDSSARKKCIEHYGFSCSVCDFDFKKVYGKVGEGYIHVHHLKQVAIAGEGMINPIDDLRPVCPNCHAMIHKRKEPFSIEELKEIMKST